MGLTQALQELHEQGKQVEISWLWDGGVDVKAGTRKGISVALPTLLRGFGIGTASKPMNVTNSRATFRKSTIPKFT